jgi:hypothetical protein
MVQDDELYQWRAFSPSLEPAAPSLVTVVQAWMAEGGETDAVEDEFARARIGHLEFPRFIAALSLLRDLVQAGWLLRVQEGEIQIRAHEVGTGESTKTSVRRQLLFGRSDQFRSEPTRRFVDDLERPGPGASRDSIVALMADGRRLAQQLRPMASVPRAERPTLLRQICRPYLQSAERGARDTETGIDLYDVWRYFRYHWTSRYRRSPGRVLPFLVRDAAQPRHPVMAILALSNGVLQLRARDEWVGWSMAGVERSITDGEFTEGELLEALRHRIRMDLADLYTEDLGFCGNAPPPLDEQLESRLQTVARDAMRARAGQLLAPESAADASSDLVTLARTPLFVAKRAIAARSLLRAHDALSRAHLPLAEALKTPSTLRAVEIALRQTKQHFASQAIMEITTCGAAPPYNHLLGGKLACLLAASPEVVSTYERRYRGEASIIASQMAGRQIVKDTTLAMLGTSSLYPGRSSQYNRVRLPANTIAGQFGELAYLEVGRSEGHGSTNLSAETESMLADVAVKRREFSNVNFVFGEGQSPKMRQIREGLDALRLGEADIIRHGSRRIVYVVPLLVNTRRFLLGVDQHPEYLLPQREDQTEHVAEYWRTRWLASRIEHSPALDALEASAPEDALVSREWRDAPAAQRRLL